jgi:hypothetical protein
MTTENATPVHWTNPSGTHKSPPPVEIVTDVAIAIGELSELHRRTEQDAPVCLLRVLSQYLLIASEQLAIETEPSYTLCDYIKRCNCSLLTMDMAYITRIWL